MKRSISAFVVAASMVGGSWFAIAPAAFAEGGVKTPGSEGNGNCLVVITTPAADHISGEAYTAMKNHC